MFYVFVAFSCFTLKVVVPFKIWSNKDEEIFAKDKVLYEGHPIGAILACNEAVARKAAALVKIQYEVLKPVVSIDDAIQANSYIEVSVSAMEISYEILSV